MKKKIIKKPIKENDFTQHKESQGALRKMINIKPISDKELKEWVRKNGKASERG